MKTLTKNEALKILKNKGYTRVRSNKHIVYKNNKGDTFLLPHSKKTDKGLLYIYFRKKHLV